MFLEMGQVDHVVVIRDMGADKIVFDPFVVLDGNLDFAFRIHDVDRGDRGESMGLGDLHVVFRAHASSRIGGVALDGRRRLRRRRCPPLSCGHGRCRGQEGKMFLNHMLHGLWEAKLRFFRLELPLRPDI